MERPKKTKGKKKTSRRRFHFAFSLFRGEKLIPKKNAFRKVRALLPISSLLLDLSILVSSTLREE